MSQSSYDRHPLVNDLPLFLTIVDNAGEGVTGADPTVSIRRYQKVNGDSLDNYYWTGTAFTATATLLDLTEVDATNSPGLYVYNFEQSDIQEEYIYNMYFQNLTVPTGIFIETHAFLSEATVESVRVYESEPQS